MKNISSQIKKFKVLTIFFLAASTIFLSNASLTEGNYRVMPKLEQFNPIGQSIDISDTPKFVFSTDDYIFFSAKFFSDLQVGDQLSIEISSKRGFADSIVWEKLKEPKSWFGTNNKCFCTKYKEGLYTANLYVSYGGQKILIEKSNFLVKNCYENRKRIACQPKVTLRNFSVSDAFMNKKDNTSPLAAKFLNQPSTLIEFYLDFESVFYEEVSFTILNKETRELVSFVNWEATAFEHGQKNYSRHYIWPPDNVRELEKGNYLAQVKVRTIQNQKMEIVHETSFAIHSSKEQINSTPLPNKTGSTIPPAPIDQLSQITELKKSLTTKIAEAEKARNEFVTEVTAINEQISKTGDKLPVKRLDRLKRDIKRKQSYVGLITEYHDKLADGFDTLDEIESEYNDRKRWRLLVEDTFIAKVDQAIRDITALINDSPVKTAKLDNTTPKKRREKR